MTDKEIIKALECCDYTTSCPEYCPLKHLNECGSLQCFRVLKKSLLDIINRQQAEIENITEKFNCQQTVYADLSKIIKDKNAEIERLKEDNFIKSQKRANIFEITSAFERGRTDGIKKFAERLNNEASEKVGIDEDFLYYDFDDEFKTFDSVADVIKFLSAVVIKEMAGDTE